MKRVDVLNLLAFLCAISLAGAGARSLATPRLGLPPAAAHIPDARVEHLADGSAVVRDADGVPVPLRTYQRIASASLVADRVLLELCEPERILAFSEVEKESANGFHYGQKAQISAHTSLERLLVLAPDLLFVSSLVDPSYVARLREHGIQVFDLGPMRGLESLPANVRSIATLIGAAERGSEYLARFQWRMANLAHLRGTRPKPRALYLSNYGDRLFGGAAHTSYHDVLERAGLRDLAAEAGFVDWPELSPEQVLSLAPEIVVTKVGMGATLCRHAGLAELGVCRGRGRILELKGALLDDPGPGMLEAAEALAQAAFGD